MKFEYKRPEDTMLEAYGKTFEIPTKTAYIVDAVMKVQKRITENGATAADQALAIRDGIALFIGEEAAEEIFPREHLINTANTDEMTAFWLCLNDISNRETEAAIAKYSPKPKSDIKVSANPKK